MKPLAPSALNYRGRRVSAALGVGLGLGAIALAGLAAVSRHRLVWLVPAVAAVFLAGLYDDTRPGRTRGMRAQIVQALQGRISPGFVKLVVIVAASAFVAWMLDVRGGRFAAGTAAIAGAANLWNLLDVRPGRALKLFVPAAAALAAAAGRSTLPLFAGLAAAGALGLVFDLGELLMLGDCGANVLGFVIGVGMLLVLPLPWLAVVLGALVVLHVLADTVTLSRLIDATPPLRFVDRLGRKKFAEND